VISWRRVTEEEFPHGLRCSSCGLDINPGGYYTSVPEGMIGSSPVEDLICALCFNLPG
jgi:hypothetical protein